MRWVLLILLALVGASLFLAWKHPAPPTIGARLAEALESDNSKTGTLRGAIQILDFSPDAPTRAAARALKLRSGAGDLPGSQLSPRPNRFWAQHDADLTGGAAQFSWETQPTVVEPARDFVAAAQPRERMMRALTSLGFSTEEGQRALAAATARIVTITDEQLFNQCLQADRGMLGLRDDVVLAVRDAMLLLAMPDDRPVLAFRCVDRTGAGDVMMIYAVALDPVGGSSAAWMDMHAYDDAGKLRWRGVLEVQGAAGKAPDAEEVRLWALGVAEEANIARPKDASDGAGIPAATQFLGQ